MLSLRLETFNEISLFLNANVAFRAIQQGMLTDAVINLKCSLKHHCGCCDWHM